MQPRGTFRRLMALLMLFGWLVAGVDRCVSGEKSAAWTEIPLDPRLVAMGGELNVLVRPWEALRSNPAGLASARRSVLAVAHTSWVQSVSGQFTGYVEARKWANLGVWGALLNVPGVERRTSRDELIGKFTAHHAVLGAGGAKVFGSGLEFGIGVRWLYQKIDVYEAGAIVADLGARKQDLPGGVIAAINARGIPLSTSLGDGGLEPRTVMTAGFARPLSLFGRAEAVLIEVDYFGHSLTSGGLVAVEIHPHPAVFLRGAYLTGYELRRFSFGVGVQRNQFFLDYGYAPFRYGFGEVHAFGLAILL